MSIKNTEKCLLDFIKSKEVQVLALKGNWGTGKTYFWKNFLLAHKNDKNLCFSNYSYVSLFGAKSIEDLKFSLLENSRRNSQIGEDINIKDIQKNYKKIAIKGFGILRRYSGSREIISLGLGFLNTKKRTLICLDDFERIGEKIDVSEILGFISELKEDRKCSIILIFNYEKLSIEKKKIYSEFREKVIDIEIKFSPSAKDCSDIIFPNELNSNEVHLKEYCIELGIKNIRIINKIKYFYETIRPYLVEYSQPFIESTIKSICLLTYAHFSNPMDDTSNSVPGVKFITSGNSVGSFVYGSEEKEEKYKINWRNFLSRYHNWYSADDFDLELLRIINRGYVIENELHKFAIIVNKGFENDNIKGKYSQLWDDYYHIGFVDNEDKFIEVFVSFYEEYPTFLSISDLNIIISVFRDLGRTKESSEIIDSFIEGNGDNLEIIDLNNFRNLSSSPLDGEIKEKMDIKYNKNIPGILLSEVLDRIIERKYSKSKRDIEILSELKEVEIYELLKDLEGSQIREYIEILFEIDSISEEIKKALEKFASCNINKSRLKSYGWLNR